MIYFLKWLRKSKYLPEAVNNCWGSSSIVSKSFSSIKISTMALLTYLKLLYTTITEQPVNSSMITCSRVKYIMQWYMETQLNKNSLATISSRLLHICPFFFKYVIKTSFSGKSSVSRQVFINPINQDIFIVKTLRLYWEVLFIILNLNIIIFTEHKKNEIAWRCLTYK